jgi:hypothetical protein
VTNTIINRGRPPSTQKVRYRMHGSVPSTLGARRDSNIRRHAPLLRSPRRCFGPL